MTRDAQSALDAALQYARLGWRVVLLHSATGGTCSCREGAACKSAGKHPRHRAWQKTATTDEEIIAGWWKRWPEANVGVAFGRESGVVDFECDTPAEERALTSLFGGEMPVTLCFRSSRGKHWLFRWHDGLPDAGAPKVAGVSVRIGGGAKGAQSVFPPSRHPSGERYRWILGPADGELAALPEAVVARIANSAGPARSGNHSSSPAEIERVAMDGAQEPHRHESAKALIGSFVSGCITRLDFEQAWESVQGWNQRNRDAAGRVSPLPKAELRSLFDWVANQERAKRPGSEWSIVRVPSDPPAFKLWTPYYSGHALLDGPTLLRWEAVRKQIINQKQVWLPGSLRKRWEGDKDNEPLGAVLLRESTVEEPEDEIVFAKAVAERTCDMLLAETEPKTKRLEEGEEPTVGRLPVRQEGGEEPGVYFVFGWLLEKLNNRTSEKVPRPKLSEVLLGMGASTRGIGSGRGRRKVKFIPLDSLQGGGANWGDIL